MNRRSTYLGAVTALVILCACGCQPPRGTKSTSGAGGGPGSGSGSAAGGGSAGGASGASGGGSAGALKAAAVRVVKKSIVRRTDQPGEISPYETTPLVAKVPGYIRTVNKDIGDPVAPGEVLAVIEAPELAEEVKQKQALEKQAAAGIAQARAGVLVAEAAVERAKALEAELQSGVDRTTADATRWKSEHDRIRSLAAGGSVTTKLLEEAENRNASATAAVAEAKAKFGSAAAAIKEAEAKVAQAKADLDAAESQQAVARSAREAAEVMTAYLEIKAPFQGYLTARNVDTGHFVSASSTGKPLLVVVRTDKVRVFVGVPEYDAQFVNPGDKATVVVQALGSSPIAGDVTITRTALNLDPQSGTLRAEIDLTNKENRLRPGLYANVSIELDRRDGVLVLPTSALFAKEGKSYCVLVKEGRAVVREVKRGLTAGSEVEILPGAGDAEGVREGDLVVLKNGVTIADGGRLEGIETPAVK